MREVEDETPDGYTLFILFKDGERPYLLKEQWGMVKVFSRRDLEEASTSLNKVFVGPSGFNIRAVDAVRSFLDKAIRCSGG